MEYEELEVEVLVHGPKAVKVKYDGGDEAWIPWSVIEDNGEKFPSGFKGKMYVAKWFCEKELIT